MAPQFSIASHWAFSFIVIEVSRLLMCCLAWGHVGRVEAEGL